MVWHKFTERKCNKSQVILAGVHDHCSSFIMDGLVKIPLMFEHVIIDVTHSNIVYVLTYSNAQDFLVLIMHFFYHSICREQHTFHTSSGMSIQLLSCVHVEF